MKTKNLIPFAAGYSYNLLGKNSNKRAFEPITSFSDAAYRAMTMVSAPLLFTAISVVSLSLSVYYLLVAANHCKDYLLGRQTFIPLNAQQNVKNSLGSSMIVILAAAMSPAVNAIDLIGAFFATLSQAVSECLTHKVNSRDVAQDQIEMQTPG